MDKIVIASFFLLLTFSQCDSSFVDKITDAARSVKNFFSRLFGLRVSKPQQTKIAVPRTVPAEKYMLELPKTLTNAAATTITMMWDVYHLYASKLQDDLSVEELSKEEDVVANYGDGEDDNNLHVDSMELDNDSEDGKDGEDETDKEEDQKSI